MSKIHKNNAGYRVADQYDSISFGEQIFVEEMPDKHIPADYERIENSKLKNESVYKEKEKSEMSLDNFISFLFRSFSVVAIIFIAYSLFGGLLDSSQMALEPFGKEAGVAFGIFVSVSIVALLIIFSKVKIKISVENESLCIKSIRGINHVIPIENIADCKINIFKNASSIKNIITSKKYKMNLEEGLLITFKDGNNLLIASSNTYQSNKNLVFNS